MPNYLKKITEVLWYDLVKIRYDSWSYGPPVRGQKFFYMKI